MNGKSVEVDNTDAEGRLVLSGTSLSTQATENFLSQFTWYNADAIYYASTEYKPHTLVDVATLTG